jgi:hypothetical protein
MYNPGMNTTASSNIVSGDHVSGIPIDSPQWFDWLGQQSSFRYQGSLTNFTCNRRPNGKWYGVKKVHSSDKGSIPIALYIGADKDCTLAKLQEIHERFSMSNWDFWRWYHSPERKGKKKQIPGGCTTDPSCTTPRRELQTECSHLQEVIAKLKQENEALRLYNETACTTLAQEDEMRRFDASTLFNQLRPLLNRLNDRERRAIQQKLEEILG